MRLFLLAATALPLLLGQPKDLYRERDADGFGNIKWGMTVAEAKAAFPGLREPYQIIRQGAPDPCKVVDGSGGPWPQLSRAPSWRTRRASAVPTPNRLPIGLFRMRLGTVYADPARSAALAR